MLGIYAREHVFEHLSIHQTQGEGRRMPIGSCSSSSLAEYTRDSELRTLPAVIKSERLEGQTQAPFMLIMGWKYWGGLTIENVTGILG